jgi:hypothetical protein
MKVPGHDFSNKQLVLQRLIALDGTVVRDEPLQGGIAIVLRWRDETGGAYRRRFEMDCSMTERDEHGEIVVIVYRERSAPVPVCFRCGRSEVEHRAWEEAGCP